jgi:hypothetical protein
MMDIIVTVLAYWLSLIAQAFNNLFDVRFW